MTRGMRERKFDAFHAQSQQHCLMCDAAECQYHGALFQLL